MSNYDDAKLAAEIYLSLLAEQQERRHPQLHHDQTLADDPGHIDLTLLEKHHDRPQKN